MSTPGALDDAIEGARAGARFGVRAAFGPAVLAMDKSPGAALIFAAGGAVVVVPAVAVGGACGFLVALLGSKHS